MEISQNSIILIIFLIALAIVMLFSKRELSVGLIIASLFLGLLSNVNIGKIAISITTDISLILIAIGVTLIPILGGIMQKAGLMEDLVKSLNISKKAALIISPALFGLLPLPGGALLSAPLVESIGDDVDKGQLAAINVWYRHVLILIYPLQSSLLVMSYLLNESLYLIVASLLIPAIFMFMIGYVFLVKSVPGNSEDHKRNLKKAFHHSIPIIIAPIIDILGRTFIETEYPEIFLVVGLFISVGIAYNFARLKISDLLPIMKKMKIWRYPLLIFAMMGFLRVFQEAGVPDVFSVWKISLIGFLILGFFLGIATGRVQLPATILIPIYYAQFAMTTMPLLHFALIYSAIFMGYVFTPVHPCIAYTIQYLEIPFSKTARYLWKPTVFGLIILIIFALFVS